MATGAPPCCLSVKQKEPVALGAAGLPGPGGESLAAVAYRDLHGVANQGRSYLDRSFASGGVPDGVGHDLREQQQDDVARVLREPAVIAPSPGSLTAPAR